MKFVLYHDPSKKNLSIPAAALKLSGLGDEEYLPDDIPPALRNVLEASGICPDCLKELVDSGETIHV